MSLSRDEKYILIALGGNAFQSKGEIGTPEEYWKNAYSASKIIVKIIEEGYKVAITHGNGPQVGTILEWMDKSSDKIPPMTMDIAGAMTQGWLGYLLMQAIHNTLIKKGIKNIVKGVITIINQVLVDVNDPAWNNPTKYVGSYYSEKEAMKISKKKNWIMKPDPRGGWRRVVPSPDPVKNIEVDAVRKLMDEGWIVIASGGGGIPVIEEKGVLKGVEAVIDKDLAGEILATGLGVGTFVILTDIDGVYLNYGKPNQVKLTHVNISSLKKYFKEGHFKPGSMGPKVLAAIRFIENGGKKVMIGHLKDGYEVVKGKKGTLITSG